jgi:hypothetical protein
MLRRVQRVQIAAILGHALLSEVQRYTAAADRKRMVRDAMAKLVEVVGPGGTPPQNCQSAGPRGAADTTRTRLQLRARAVAS